MSQGEFELIDQLLKPLARGYPGALDLTDDAALVDLGPGMQLVIAKDAMVAGVHFLPDDPPDLIAGKLLRVNLSDLAAMGADPLGYLTVLALPAELPTGWAARWADGLARDQAAYGLHLLGGDTVGTPGPLTLTLTILGTVPTGQALRRNGAHPGDIVAISGTLGDAALGLRILRGLAAPEEDALALTDRYRTPRPRVALGRALRGLATAAIDVSDGFMADLGHIVAESKVGAEVKAGLLPISPEARGLPAALESALSGGDDYELAFTFRPENEKLVREAATVAGTPVTLVGLIVEGRGVTVRDAAGKPLVRSSHGWRHF